MFTTNAAFSDETSTQSFSLEFLRRNLPTAGVVNALLRDVSDNINAKITDLSTNYYTYRTNNDISLNLNDLSSNVLINKNNISSNLTIINDVSSNLNDLSAVVDLLETNGWVGTATSGLDMSGYDISNIDNLFAAIGREAGRSNMEGANVAIGYLAAQYDMSDSSVAIGFFAGQNNMGFSYQVHCLLEGMTKDDDIFEKLRVDIRDVASGWDLSFISIGNGDYYPPPRK